MSFVALTPAETDADSPLNEPLFTKIRNNFDALESAGVTGGDAHDHDGGDGAQIPQGGIAANAIGQGQLKTASGAISTSSTSQVNLILPGGQYGFYPQTKGNFGLAGVIFAVGNIGASYVTNITLEAATGTVYAQQRYSQASPPYKVGNKKWGHFLYILVNAQGDIVASYEAEDPPYAYNGSPHNKKDSIERIQAVPHPFADYHDKDPAIDGLEIVLVDLTAHNTKKWKEDSAKQGKGILENMGHINKKGSIITPQELGIVDIQGFTDRVKIRKAI